MNIGKMKAWLLTWQWYDSKHPDKVAAIISSRKSEKYIQEIVELLVKASEYNATDMAYFANKRHKSQYQASGPLVINDVPHGERLICGSDPKLYARKVAYLQIKRDKISGEEVVSWKEPDDFKWFNSKRNKIVVAAEGAEKTIRRANESLMKNE
jgi:hypothetical protein